MSTTPSLQPASAPPPPISDANREIRIYSHSALFYWWPVWFVGFIMAMLTGFDGHRMALVPPGTVADSSRTVSGHEEKGPVDVLIVPKGKELPRSKVNSELIQPHLHMARSKDFGVVFVVVLLVIIIVSNVPLRGLWSVIIILFAVLVTVILALAGAWEWILDTLYLVDVRINMGGYLLISLVLLALWAVTVFIFDHRTYVVISSGQVRVCLAVGAGETMHDTTTMTVSKKQDDLFRHWIVGLGSGDLILKWTNTNQEIDLANVLFIGAKIKEIERLVKERQVV
jgi:hypothetical protein